MSRTGPGGSSRGSSAIGDKGTRPEVDATVRLLHRRRGWGWTGAAGVVALMVFSVIGSHLWANASGALGLITGLVVLVLLALAVVGLIMAAVGTIRLGRVLLAGCLVLAIGYLPDQVNGVAYLTGASPTATFFPTSYGQNCGRGGCTTITDGTLAEGGRSIRASWPGVAPLDLPMTVRVPVWDGRGATVSLTGDAANAIIAIIVGLFLDAVGVLAGLALIEMTRHWLKRRRGAVLPRSPRARVKP